jgi:hypothetical protein
VDLQFIHLLIINNIPFFINFEPLKKFLPYPRFYNYHICVFLSQRVFDNIGHPLYETVFCPHGTSSVIPSQYYQHMSRTCHLSRCHFHIIILSNLKKGYHTFIQNNRYNYNNHCYGVCENKTIACSFSNYSQVIHLFLKSSLNHLSDIDNVPQ